MHPVVIRSNITCNDKLSYFSSHWSDHMASMSKGWLTDIRMIGREGDAWDCVAVHKAIILPLCPLLAIMERDLTKEDPSIILPDHPLELIQAFVHLIYQGSAPTSDIVTIKNLLELMACLGLNMPADRLQLDRAERKEVEIVGFKNHYGLEIIELNHGMIPQVPACVQSSSKRSLEITPCPQDPSTSGQKVKRRRLSKIVKNLEIEEKAQGRISSERKGDKVAEHRRKVNNNNVDAHNITQQHVPVEVKLECEDYIDIEDSQPVKKRRKRRESLEKLAHAHNCEFCDFKCNIKKDLQEHCEEVHTDKNVNCSKCPFKGLSIHGLRIHEGRKHSNGGSLFCEICGFIAERKRALDRHMAKSHLVTDLQQLGEEESVKKSSLENKNEDGLDEKEDVLIKAVVDHNVEDSECLTLGINETAPDPSLLVEKKVKASSGLDPIGIDTEKNITNEQDVETAPALSRSQAILKETVNSIKADNEVNETNLSSKRNDVAIEDGKDCETVSAPNKKREIKDSSELVGFKCGVPGCERVCRVKYTTATYALNRLKTHHAKVHTELEESEFHYVNLFKEDSENPKQVDETTLKILKKVKASHKKAVVKTNPGEVRVNQVFVGGDENSMKEI